MSPVLQQLPAISLSEIFHIVPSKSGIYLWEILWEEMDMVRKSRDINPTVKELAAIKSSGYHAAGGGLYLSISASGSRSWVFRYVFNKRQREMGLGSLTKVTLAAAREKAREARETVGAGGDPLADRQARKSALAAAVEKSVTFEWCASEFIKDKSPEWKNAKHAAQWTTTLEQYAYPVIGKMLVKDVELPHILAILRPIWKDKTETATRLRGRIDNVLDWATVHEYRTGPSPARWKGHLDKLLSAPNKTAKVEHHAALPHAQIGAFMVSLRGVSGNGARALEFAILTASRSGEVRGATWSEIDLKAGVWTIPEGRMKAGKEHRIPLSQPAIDLLNGLAQGEGADLVFPAPRGGMLSDMTLTAVLRRMAVAVTAHGFRSTFRDWAGETTAHPREVIEHALAHQLKDAAEAAYARGTLFDKRRRVMDDWARYCGTVQVIADNVVNIRAKVA